MANRYWVGGSANFDATAGSKWALTSGGAGGQAVPTNADDVFFDGASGAVTVTVTATSTCKSLTFTGFTGTFAGSSQITVGDGTTATALFATGNTMSWTGILAFLGTGNLTGGGTTLACPVTINNAGKTITLQSDFTTTSDFTLTAGTFSANNFNITVNTFASNNTNTRTITMGSGTWTMTAGNTTAWTIATTTNLTLNQNTSTLKFTGNSAQIDVGLGASKTYYNIWNATTGGAVLNFINGASATTINDLKCNAGTTTQFQDTGTTTVSSFTATGTAGNLIVLQGSGSGGWNLSKSSGTVTASFISVSRCAAAGGATWNATHSVDGGNNTGWVFITGTDRYWVGGANSWDGTAGSKWADISGGPSGVAVPTSSNDVYFDATSGAVTVTVTASSQAKNLTCTGFTGTLAGSSALAVAGNLILASGMTLTYSGTITVSVTGNITTAGKSITFPIIFNGSGQTFTVTDAFSSNQNVTLTLGTLTANSSFLTSGTFLLTAGTFNCTGALTVVAFTITNGTVVLSSTYTGTGAFLLTAGSFTMGGDYTNTSTITITAGTFNANNFNVTALSLSSSGTGTRTITLGSGTITLTGTGTVWDTSTPTNLTMTATTSTIKLTNSSASSKTFAGGGKTFGNFWNNTGSTGVVIITGSNTFTDFKITGDGRTTQFTAGTTTTLTTLTMTGIAQVITSVTSATHTISVTSGTIEVQNTTISYSIATGGATFLARTSYSNVNGGNNTGWTFALNINAYGFLLLV